MPFDMPRSDVNHSINGDPLFQKLWAEMQAKRDAQKARLPDCPPVVDKDDNIFVNLPEVKTDAPNLFQDFAAETRDTSNIFANLDETADDGGPNIFAAVVQAVDTPVEATAPQQIHETPTVVKESEQTVTLSIDDALGEFHAYRDHYMRKTSWRMGFHVANLIPSSKMKKRVLTKLLGGQTKDKQEIRYLAYQCARKKVTMRQAIAELPVKDPIGQLHQGLQHPTQKPSRMTAQQKTVKPVTANASLQFSTAATMTHQWTASAQAPTSSTHKIGEVIAFKDKFGEKAEVVVTGFGKNGKPKVRHVTRTLQLEQLAA